MEVAAALGEEAPVAAGESDAECGVEFGFTVAAGRRQYRQWNRPNRDREGAAAQSNSDAPVHANDNLES